ncbi:zinc-dependent peptidase [Aromatoleum diolicum]|uniref:Zinc-dependent peptidase n=1 Tax=Aromatoleum diolicum TaxID=75796 RepID=A0ABX1Q6X8_9RHOO|nr:M90 family metallopeptidase [Aromatoleum diolicum]NMG74119.1 hypothetical protein [Aromatoleum diolicum]
MFEFLRKWRHTRRLAAVQVPEAMWVRVEARLRFLDYLTTAHRAQLRELARAFIAEKQFHGAQGLVLNDQIILAIALQACLPVLRVGLGAYRGWVGVVVYPGDFVIPRQEMDAAGVVHEYDDEVLGEAWEGGPVLVSWYGQGDAPDGVNVVIHEFAHKLDMLNGTVDGLPILPADMSRKVWAEAFSDAYERFCDQVDSGRDTALDPYAAEHPGEFFAVASEAFFETPCMLQREFPAIYEQLSMFYRADPATGERRLRNRCPGSGNVDTAAGQQGSAAESP